MEKENPIKFGTDGWRGIIAEDFTFENVRVCAQAVADYLKEAGLAEKGLVIGYDTRFASEDFAEASAGVVAGNGIRVYLSRKSAPTPVISYGVTQRGAGGAIIITASHNKARWNGFKLKSPDGASAPTEVIAALERNIARILKGGGVKAGTPRRELVEEVDLDAAYLEQIARLVNLEELRRVRAKVVTDAMYGAGAGYFEKLLSGGNIELIELNGERNPLFPGIQPEPIAANLGKLSARVKAERAAVGLATDGDADRIGIIDENGQFLTQLQVFALLCLYLLETRGGRGAIIRTLTTSSMLTRLGEIYDVPVYETPVGFKYVAPLMLSEKALIGGEESGGYGFRGHIPERDGILAGLYFLDFMARGGKTPAQLLEYLYKKVGPHYYKRIDMELPARKRPAVAGRLEVASPAQIDGVAVARKDVTDGFRFVLTDSSWLLVRFSGTEPLLRIYAESDSPDRVDRLLESGRRLAGI